MRPGAVIDGGGRIEKLRLLGSEVRQRPWISGVRPAGLFLEQGKTRQAHGTQAAGPGQK